jgi:hypothetical protein
MKELLKTSLQVVGVANCAWCFVTLIIKRKIVPMQESVLKNDEKQTLLFYSLGAYGTGYTWL